MSTFSATKKGTKNKALYDQHLTGEVVNNLTEAKQIANDYAANKRYPHRVTVTTVGNANVKPYYPIYLDGLPNGLSGYWTVLSVTHVFGGIPAKYMLNIEAGTDVIGDVDPNASKNVATRDVQGEINGKTMPSGEEPVLVEVQLSPNSSSMEDNYGSTTPTTATVTSAVEVPNTMTANMYAVTPPNFSQISRTVTWAAKTGNKVTNA